MSMRTLLLGMAIALASLVSAPAAVESTSSDFREIRAGDPRHTLGARVRARAEGGFVFVEFQLEDGFHVYALDNVDRVRSLTGEAEPRTQASTAIDLANGEVVGGIWWQPTPVDLSDAHGEIVAWGYAKSVTFVARYGAPTGPRLRLTVFAQVCSEQMCIVARDIVLTADVLPLTRSAPEILANLMPVKFGQGGPAPR